MNSNLDLSGIKNVIFDLGGVVITLDRDRAVRSLAAIGLEEADTLLGLYRQEEPFLALETGRITAAEFFDIIRRKCPGASDKDIQTAFNSFLIEIPRERLEMLDAMHDAGFRTYVLSNTNPVMFNSWIAEAFASDGKRINDYFDGIVTSFAEGTCKPDVELFRTVLHRYALPAEETVMLDDSEANCNAARLAGMPAIRIGATPADDMIAVCTKLIDSKNCRP